MVRKVTPDKRSGSGALAEWRNRPMSREFTVRSDLAKTADIKKPKWRNSQRAALEPQSGLILVAFTWPSKCSSRLPDVSMISTEYLPEKVCPPGATVTSSRIIACPMI